VFFIDKQNKAPILAGSLRTGFFNKLVRAALEGTPSITAIEIYNLEGIPPYNADLKNNPPQKVVEFKEKILASDALLIATLEYSYTIQVYSKTLSTRRDVPQKDDPL